MRSFLYKICRIIVAVGLAFSIVITASFFVFEGNFREILINYSKSVAFQIVNTILNDAVHSYLNENNVEYSKLANIIYSDEMTVNSVTFDTVLINKLKSGIVSLIQGKISSKDKVVIEVPIGTVIGNAFTVNRGPGIKTDMTISSAVKSEMLSSFKSAGINQTLHEIVLNLSVDTYFVTPWYRATETLKTEFIISETIIVGKVPGAYTVVIESENDNIGGLINDYGASNFID